MTDYVTPRSCDLPWFALRIKPRHEKSATQLIEAAGYESFLPIYQTWRRWSQRWKELELPLFPGYLFARFDRNGWSRLMNIPGVIDAVRFGKMLAPVDEQEVNALRLVHSSKYTVEPCLYFPAGHNVTIQNGPLSGLQGSVLEDKGQRYVVISVSLLQRSVRVRIERDEITAVDLPPSVLPVRSPIML